MNDNYITLYKDDIKTWTDEDAENMANSARWDMLVKDVLFFYQEQVNEEKRDKQLQKLNTLRDIMIVIEKYCIKERYKQGVIFPIHPASNVESLLPTDRPIIQSFINRLSDGRVNENKRFLKKNEMEIVNKMWKIYKPVYDKITAL